MKEFGPIGGARPACPLDPPMIFQQIKKKKKKNLYFARLCLSQIKAIIQTTDWELSAQKMNLVYCGLLCCLVMISIDLSQTSHFAHWKYKTMSETNFFSDNFYFDNFFFNKKSFSRTGFCLRLNFVSDFVSDYIQQLYFGCNYLISTISF